MNFKRDFPISHMENLRRSLLHVVSFTCYLKTAPLVMTLPPFHTNHVIRYKESYDQMQGVM